MGWPIPSETLGKCVKVKKVQLLFGGSAPVTLYLEGQTETPTTMAHTHSIKTQRNMPFGGTTLYFCGCGARKSSDGAAITNGILDTEGWYVERQVDEMDEAYDLLQNEGHPIKRRDTQDLLDSHMPNLD